MTDASVALSAVDVSTARSVPTAATAVGYAVAPKGAVARQLGISRSALEANGFTGKLGQTLVVPSSDGVAVAVGVGDDPDANALRTAAASFSRAASQHARLATNLADVDGVDPGAAGQAVAEGALLASYRYVGLKNDADSGSKLKALTLVAGGKRAKAVEQGAARGSVIAAAQGLARELANTPPTYLNAKDIAARAVDLGSASGLHVEVFNRDQLEQLGCGGLLGVNRGSTEPPRMVKLTYSPRNPVGHLALVGKGIMYDSGGISLKPSDAFHQVMKMDMSGAAAVLSLAVEEEPDAIVDIATLTGSALGALGPQIAALLGNDQGLVDQVKERADAIDEPVWQLPLEKQRYRKLLDSVVADMRNIGGPYGGTITASIFLSEFAGDVPWAHLDIAGPMKVDGDEGIHSKGATGFGTRLLIDLACNFTPPA